MSWLGGRIAVWDRTGAGTSRWAARLGDARTRTGDTTISLPAGGPFTRTRVSDRYHPAPATRIRPSRSDISPIPRPAQPELSEVPRVTRSPNSASWAKVAPFLGVALEARTIGAAVCRRARDLGPRSHAVPVLGRSCARRSTRSASRKVLICSEIRERCAQDERRPARGLRYQLTCLARGRRNDIRANAPAQPPCHSKPPVPTTTAWVTRGPASAPARQAGSAKPTPYSTGIAFGSPSPVTSPH